MNCSSVLRFLFVFALVAPIISIGNRTFAQDKTYHSDVDDLLTLERVSVLPFTDNLQGIYARPLEAHFIQAIQNMHRWDYVPANSSGPILSPEELEASPEKAKSATQGLGADAFFSARMTKGPNGVMIHVSLFLVRDGKLLLQAILKDYSRFEIADLKDQLDRLLKEITDRLPYAGRVLSRDVNRVTVNLGRRDGLTPNQVLSVIQIIQAHRHPKFNFLIKTEKEIFGRIKVLKVEDTLSFGVVVSEKERGAIQKNAKIGSLDYVNYASTDNLGSTPTAEEVLQQREDGAVAFGKDAKAWQPMDPPLFGQVGARLGLGQFTGNTQVTGVGGLDANTNIAPLVVLDGELWITPQITMHARLKQGILPIKNPRANSSPKNLNQSYSFYEALAGYTVRLGPNASSPQIEPFLGFYNASFFVDNASPEAFMSSTYSGFKFGLRGQSPVGDSGLYGAGGEFSMALTAALNESPQTSGGSSKPSAVQFGLFGYRRMGERLRLQVHLDFEMYGATFSGAGTRAENATSTSQRFTTVTGGIYYQF